jgi:hypothetical protein
LARVQPDGRHAAAGDQLAEIELGRRLLDLAGRISCVEKRFPPASTSKLKLWNVESGQLVRTIEGVGVGWVRSVVLLHQVGRIERLVQLVDAEHLKPAHTTLSISVPLGVGRLSCSHSLPWIPHGYHIGQ